MDKIFIDLEMNPIEEKIELAPYRYLSREIIEIGAIKLDEDDEVASQFSEYIRPTLAEEIAANITELTGITTEMVAEAGVFTEVFARFLDWCGEDYEIFSWSKSDLRQMQAEHTYKIKERGERDAYLFDHWKDYQMIYGSLFGFERKMALSVAVDLSGKDFAGKAHGALVDASNTAGLYLQTKGRTFGQLMDKLDEGKEECTMSLGNLLSGFKLDN